MREGRGEEGEGEREKTYRRGRGKGGGRERERRGDETKQERGGEGREGRGGEGRGGEGEIKTNILGAEEVAPWLRALAVWSIPKHPHGSPQPFITPVPGEAKAAFWLASSGTACTRSTGIH